MRSIFVRAVVVVVVCFLVFNEIPLLLKKKTLIYVEARKTLGV